MAATPTIRCYKIGSVERQSGASASVWKVYLPEPTNASNYLGLFVETAGSTISSVTDNKSNAWTVQINSAPSQSLSYCDAVSVAAGTYLLTVTLSGADFFVGFYAVEIANVLTSAAYRTGAGQNVATSTSGTSVSAGTSIGSAGDIILAYITDTTLIGNTTTMPYCASTLTANSPLTLLAANLQDGTALAYTVATGSLNPAFTVTPTATSSSQVLAVAIKPNASNVGSTTLPSPGKFGWLDQCIRNGRTTDTFSFPYTGNAVFIGQVHGDATHVSSITQTGGGTYNAVQGNVTSGGITGDQYWATSLTPSASNIITLNWSASTGSPGMAEIFDIVNSGTTIGTKGNLNGTSSSSGTVTFGTITPQNASSQVFLNGGVVANSATAPVITGTGIIAAQDYNTLEAGGDLTGNEADPHGWWEPTNTSAQTLTWAQQGSNGFGNWLVLYAEVLPSATVNVAVAWWV